MEKRALIIFQKNRELGTVKTRLAATIGDEEALTIYEALLDTVHRNLQHWIGDRFLYFSDYLENDQRWKNSELRIQQASDLGIRMQCALNEVLNSGYSKAVLIGTDCPEITMEIVENAFQSLDETDYVIGPASDGGYYLIGTKATDHLVFQGKKWSTDTVCAEAICSIEQLGKTVTLVKQLNDIDTEEDLKWLKI
jgi:uncharacterized protein